MTHWMNWLVLAGGLVILEMFSGTFYLLMIAIGMVAGAAAAFGGMPLEIQMLVAAVVGIFTATVLHRSRFGKSRRTDSTRDPNVNLDIGQSIDIETWIDARQSGGRPTTRAMYRGALWDVELSGEDKPVPGRFTIREIQGSRLIVGGHR
ncbi:MAG: NfeD family protein [Herminiimonas sp.]|nr:NfeD family protein [Herminiimonas sp.]